ncbi:MAG: 5'-nucleotidase, lipoprotein e(P4) family [Luteimonas sp.]
MRILPVVSVLATLLLSACASMPAARPASVAAQAPPADDSLNATVWFQTSVERELVFREIYRAARTRLDAALVDKSWDALPKEDRDNDPRALPPAIIVDVDETVLDNSPNQVRQIRDGRGFNDADWGRWVNQRAAKALPGAAEFLRDATAKGVIVFYISNRDADQAAATFDNLRTAGFPINDSKQFLGAGMVVAGCEQQGNAKSCRRRLVGRGYRVLMQFGDQVGDFVRIADNSHDGRRVAIAPYLEWIGERWWTLPNPLYGSWESAVSGKSQDPSARRAAKQAALDDAR